METAFETLVLHFYPSSLGKLYQLLGIAGQGLSPIPGYEERAEPSKVGEYG
jgi:hypothetical protein